MSKVETERRGRSFVVTINRPEVHNAVDGETAGLLYEAVEAFRRDDYLDVLILTGAGDVAFCSGADLGPCRTSDPPRCRGARAHGHQPYHGPV